MRVALLRATRIATITVPAPPVRRPPAVEIVVGYRVFNAVVVVFWLSTMTWLIVAKVLPPLQVGEPPNYRSVYAVDRNGRLEPVCWEMLWSDRRLGWAKTTVYRTPSGVTEVRSLVHFSHVPVEELVPAWIRPAVKSAIQPVGALSMDALSRIEIDPLGRLSQIYSSLSPVGHKTGVVIRGRVRGTTLTGEVRSGTMSQPFERYLPPNALFGDELSPQARMPGLRLGQEWTVPVYSPLRFSDSRNPVEILHAKVEDRESVVIGDESVLTSVVVYRSDPGSIHGGAQTPRGRLWVADDGTVLKQTSRLFGSQLTFLRASPGRAAQILEEAKPVERRMSPRRQQVLEQELRLQGAAHDSGQKVADQVAGETRAEPAKANGEPRAAETLQASQSTDGDRNTRDSNSRGSNTRDSNTRDSGE
jgi:hypothetical protein